MTSAWLDTSMAQAVTPCSTIAANRACRSGASGVVSEVFTSWPAMRVPTVPITAAVTPAAVQSALEEACRGGLALRAGHGHQGERAGGLAVEACGQAAEHGAGVLEHQQRHVGPLQHRGARLVGEHGHGAGGDRVRGVRRTVGPAAGQGRVDVAGPDALAAQRETGGHPLTGGGVGRPELGPGPRGHLRQPGPRRVRGAGEVQLRHQPRLSMSARRPLDGNPRGGGAGGRDGVLLEHVAEDRAEHRARGATAARGRRTAS